MELFDGTSCGDRLSELAAGLLRGARDVDGLAQALAVVVATAEEEADRSGARQTACRQGCPRCCVLNVTVLLPEGVAIAAHLNKVLAGGERTAMLDRLDRQRRLVRWMEDGERVRRQIGCPFLDPTGSCTIHPFRPLMCRGVTSLDSELCREALDPTELDAPYAVPMDLVRKQAMDEAFRALARAMAGCGMETRGVELSAAVWAFLAQPELCGRFLAGVRLPPELWE